jgi:two-component system, sporulation sensor kinase E
LSVPQQFQLSFSGESLNRFFLNGDRNCFVILDSTMRIVNCSPAFYTALGFTEHEVVGSRLNDFLQNEEDLDQLEAAYSNGDDHVDKQWMQFRHAAGLPIGSRFLSARMNSVTEGDSYHWLQLLDLDVKISLNLLQRFAGMFMKDVNLGVILIDTDFNLVDISDMACRILGFERDAIINRPVEDVFAAVPTEHQILSRNILEGMVVRNHAVSWTNDQERYELLMDSNVLKDEFGKVVGAYIIFKDVTNLRSLEEQVKRSDRLSMIGQIAAGTAHEIRNPLTSIKGFMQVLKNTFIEKQMDKEKGYTEIMLTEIDRINELVSEFLLLSKRKNAVFHQVDVSTVLRGIIPIINNEAILHDVNVLYEPALTMPKVVADGELLKQVFLNISKNGIEAMVDGGTLTIAEKVDPDERNVHIVIHDTGPGIPNFLIDKIFDPFFTTKESGTGLGLSVCQRIVHDMGGIIRVSSKGFGTTFSVCLPYP